MTHILSFNQIPEHIHSIRLHMITVCSLISFLALIISLKTIFITFQPTKMVRYLIGSKYFKFIVDIDSQSHLLILSYSKYKRTYYLTHMIIFKFAHPSTSFDVGTKTLVLDFKSFFY